MRPKPRAALFRSSPHPIVGPDAPIRPFPRSTKIPAAKASPGGSLFKEVAAFGGNSVGADTIRPALYSNASIIDERPDEGIGPYDHTRTSSIAVGPDALIRPCPDTLRTESYTVKRSYQSLCKAL